MSFSPEFLRQMCVDKDAEIERLKEANQAITFQYLEARSLLAECAQALALWKQTFGLPTEHQKLLERLREATK